MSRTSARAFEALMPRYGDVHIAPDHVTTRALGGRDKLKYLAGTDRHRGERTGFVFSVDIIKGA